MKRLENKVAIVTGAAAGMGKAEAILFASQGAKVVATDIDTEALDEVVTEINDEYGTDQAIGITHDVTDEDDWKAVVKNTIDKFGKIDILVNNAGIVGDAYENLWELDMEDYQNVININQTGNILGIKSVVPEMKKNGSGSIVNISSVAGIVGAISGENLAYAASKGANRAFTKDLAINVAEHDIRVNSVHPGVIDTAILDDVGQEFREEIESDIPLGFVGKPQDVANGVLFLASDESRFVTGAELVIDGGHIAR